MAVHDRVREVRLSKKVTATFIAKSVLNISPSAYCYKEKGKRSFKAEEIKKIAEALSVDPGIFFATGINGTRNNIA